MEPNGVTPTLNTRARGCRDGTEPPKSGLKSGSQALTRCGASIRESAALRSTTRGKSGLRLEHGSITRAFGYSFSDPGNHPFSISKGAVFKTAQIAFKFT
jgi:hypothetical protein